jgi:hypothetical protein
MAVREGRLKRDQAEAEYCEMLRAWMKGVFSLANDTRLGSAPIESEYKTLR